MQNLRWRQLFLLVSAVGMPCIVWAQSPSDKAHATVSARLHGLQLTLDSVTGSILRLEHPGPGTWLDTVPNEASLVDLAYPIPQFEPLRLAPRFSRDARISVSPDHVVVRWERLGPSRTAFDLPGRVSAAVTLKAGPDGQSIIMRCRVENHSQIAVRQVLFPDLLGLIPLGSAGETEFRSGPVVHKPFVALAKPEVDQFYSVNQTFVEFTSTGKEPTMAGRWLDLSGAKGGFSLFPKRSQWDTGPVVMLQFRERANRLRMVHAHYVNLTNGQIWESEEYWLTPHEGHWTKGRAPFTAWLEGTKKGSRHE
jgi:hypothetical protein